MRPGRGSRAEGRTGLRTCRTAEWPRKPRRWENGEREGQTTQIAIPGRGRGTEENLGCFRVLVFGRLTARFLIRPRFALGRLVVTGQAFQPFFFLFLQAGQLADPFRTLIGSAAFCQKTSFPFFSSYHIRAFGASGVGEKISRRPLPLLRPRAAPFVPRSGRPFVRGAGLCDGQAFLAERAGAGLEGLDLEGEEAPDGLPFDRHGPAGPVDQDIDPLD